MEDNIIQLPTDTIEQTPQEVQILNTLFNETKTNKRFNIEIKNLIIIFILFIIISLPQINQLLEKILPITTKSLYANILIKSLLFVLVYWLILNFALIKN